MPAEESIRIHTFRDLVAVSTPNTKQLYFSPQNAKALARELNRYADNIENKNERVIATRNIKDGKATTESTGKSKVVFI